MRVKQKTIVERMKPHYPALTQPIVSACARREKSGVQYTVAFRRKAEEEGISFRKDRDGRLYSTPFRCRLTDDEAEKFNAWLTENGKTQQEVLRGFILRLIRRAE